MLILDENSKTTILDSVTTPLPVDFIWVLDLNMMDYTITPLIMLEEVVAPTSTLEVNGFQFKIPSLWHILVVSEENTQIDTIHIGKELAGKYHTILIYGSACSMVGFGHVKVVDYEPIGYNYVPSLSKHQMLCHPIGPNEWVNVAPTDASNKYLRDKLVGDIIG